MTAEPMRVAFSLIGGRNWTGGYNYLLNLLSVLAEEAPGSLRPVLLAGSDVSQPELAPFRDLGTCEVVQSPVFDEAARPRLLARALLVGRVGEVQTLLRQHRVDVVFESAVFLGWRLNRPAVAWVPDLQHRFLPHLFSRPARWRRELGFQAQIRSGRSIMVSSEDTRQACLGLYRLPPGRVQAVRFAVRAPVPLDDAAARAVADRHGLPERYFFMPNQFWVHKNHRLVVEALALLKAQGTPVTVVASGKQLDGRDPDHAPALLQHARDLGLSQEFRALGMLPYADLQPLMQASVALLNPSLFEGWSTTVEEARAAGVPMVLSDLAVHREQAGGEATFFDRTSARALADALRAFVPLPPAERLARRETARAQARARVRRFATDFCNLVDACAGRQEQPR
jgi:glycosyltransferase involved in cell wall biosynthesis